MKKYHKYLYGHQFPLKTDHKQLIHIFSEKKATLTMASSRIQRLALTLGAYSYTIQFRKGCDNGNADALSRLHPKRTTKASQHCTLDGVSWFIPHYQFTNSSFDRPGPHCIQSQSMDSHRMPREPPEDEEFCPYFYRKNELSVEDGCVLWGNRVVIPEKGKETALSMLHQAHPGITHIKSLAG